MTAPVLIGIFDKTAIAEHRAKVKREECIGWRAHINLAAIPPCRQRSDLQLRIDGFDPRLEARYSRCTLELFHVSSATPIWRDVIENLQIASRPVLVWKDDA